MAPTLEHAPSIGHPPHAGLPLRSQSQAKAALRNPQTDNATGRAIQKAQQTLGWSLKEFSDHAHRGERQLAAWMNGSEHAQLDTLYAIPAFRSPLLIALASIAGVRVKVTTTITIEEEAA